MNQNLNNLANLLKANRENINNNFTDQIDEIKKKLNYKQELKAFYDAKCEWLSSYTQQMEIAFKKVNLSITTFRLNVRDSKNCFGMPDWLSVDITASMVGSRKPIKKSYNNSKQLKISGLKLETSLLAAMPVEMATRWVSVNHYSLEAREDGSAGTVLITISFK